MSESELANMKSVSVNVTDVVEESKATSKKNAKKKNGVDKYDNSDVKSKKGTRKSENSSITDGRYNKKIPLFDQSVIMEGSRNRKTIICIEKKTPSKTKKFILSSRKYVEIEIPRGEGTPLGKIPNINARLKRLRLNILKELHRTLFGKCGDPTNFVYNLQRFCGFTFDIDSDQYNRKKILLNKFSWDEVKQLLYLLDLDVEIKKKENSIKKILDFLVSPDQSETAQTTQPVGHPKRKATKRNYENADVEEIEPKKKKKPTPASKSAPREKEDEESKENNKVKSKPRTKKGSQIKNTAEDEPPKEEAAESDNASDLKKPAKKRKRNQVIEEQVPEHNDTPEPETKSKKKKTSGNSKRKEDAAADSDVPNNADRSSENEEEKVTTDLTDEELKEFLKKILADANLEKTTMKTVYNLITTHYPNYNFGKKKEFITEVVKSLIQS